MSSLASLTVTVRLRLSPQGLRFLAAEAIAHGVDADAVVADLVAQAAQDHAAARQIGRRVRRTRPVPVLRLVRQPDTTSAR